MKYVRYVPGLVLALSLMSCALPAFAVSISNDSTDPSYAQLPFQFYCNPYTSTFTSGGGYDPADGKCEFSVPSTITGQPGIALYQGQPGSGTATYVGGGQAFTGGGVHPTLVGYSPYSFSSLSPQNGDQFFAVVYDFGTLGDALYYYYTGGTPLPSYAAQGTNYFVLPWVWQVPPPPDTVPPSITITTPADAATYVSTDLVTPQVSITDASSTISTTSYTLNGSTVNPSQPLPLSVGQEEFVVSATDSAGNTGYATSTFTVIAPDTQPPAITIVTPQNGGSYQTTDTVIPSVTITDNSGSIGLETYALNGTVVDPQQPLPLTAGQDEFVVSATDSSGNTGYATSTFMVTAPVVDTTPPEVDITSPLKNGVYARADSLFLTADISDDSAIAATHYYLDGAEIDATKPLPLSTAKIGRHTVRVTATDVAGNIGEDSRSFIVVGSKNSCVLDIVAILSGIKSHDWPDKPTLAQTIQDCAALAKSLHRYDDDGSHTGDHDSHYYNRKPLNFGFPWQH